MRLAGRRADGGSRGTDTRNATAQTRRSLRSGGHWPRGGTDVVLAGHDHHYERFAPIDGIRSFVVGTGGRSHYPVLHRLPASRAVEDTAFGVLKLTLREGSFAWRFLPVAGSTFRDNGSAGCR